MAEFVRQHRCQLVAAADRGNQTQMQAQITTRQGKRIDAAVTPQHDLPGKTLVDFTRQVAPAARCCKQRLPDLLNIFGQHRVIDIVGIAVDFACNTVTQLALRAGGERTSVAERWQLAGACSDRC